MSVINRCIIILHLAVAMVSYLSKTRPQAKELPSPSNTAAEQGSRYPRVCSKPVKWFQFRFLKKKNHFNRFQFSKNIWNRNLKP